MNKSPARCHNTLVLFSGGVDSLACLHYYRDGGFHVQALFVDYGQAAASNEHAAASAIGLQLGINLRRVSVGGIVTPPGEIRGRNSLLLNLALMVFPWTCGLVSLGIHSGTTYADCSPSFQRRMNDTFDIYTNGRIKVDAPFLDWKKGDVYRYARAAGLPTELTYSCDIGAVPPCGVCTSCRDVEAASAR